MKTRILAILSGLGLLLCLSSCLQVQQILTLMKDGSGTFVEEVLMSPQMVAMAAMQAPEGGAAALDPMAKMLDEAQYKTKAASYGEGVSFVKVEKAEKNGWKGAKVTYKFKDINTVKLSPGSALNDLGPGDAKDDEEPVRFAYKDGTLTMKFPDIGDGEAAPAEAAPVDPQAEAMMKSMFAEMKITTKLVFEPGIASTNATHRDGDTVTVMEMDFGEIIKNPKGIASLQQMEGKDRAETAKLLEGVNGVKIETKEEVTVTLK